MGIRHIAPFTGRDKLWPHDLVSHNERLIEPDYKSEWARMCEVEPERARVSQRVQIVVVHYRMDYNKLKNWGSFLAKRKNSVLLVAKMLLTRYEPKKWKKNAWRAHPAVYPALTLELK